MIRFLSICLLPLFLGGLAVAENKNSAYGFRHISGENGLSQSNIKTILQDSYGFMWFGTKNGLNRYDGTSIVQMDCDDLVAGVGNHNISALFEDAERQLWVGTDLGVYRYNPEKDIFTAINMPTKEGVVMDTWVSNIVQDTEGNIWILLPDQGVFRYRDGQLYFYEVIDKSHFKNEMVNCICVAQNGCVWLGTWQAGLWYYEPSVDAFHAVAEDADGRSLKDKDMNTICNYGDGFAIAVQEGEVLKYDPETNKMDVLDLPEIKHTIVRNVNCINHKLWIGTHDGLFVVDEKANEVICLKQDLMQSFSLSDNIIYTTYQDREGGIWVGTMFGGVNYLPHNELSFDRYVPDSDKNSLTTQRIREIVSDDSGHIWIGTEDGGVNVLDIATGEITQPFYTDRVVNRDATLAMYAQQGTIVCGLFKQGVDVFVSTGKYIRHYTPKELNIDEGSVYAYYVDNMGNSWIGTGWGLYKSLAGNFSFERVAETGYDWIFDIFQDRDGWIWFSSMGGGLWKYDPKNESFKKYVYEKGKHGALSSNSVSSVMQDKKGRLWISTDRGGICRYNPERDDFTTYSLHEGLPDDVAYKILEDDSGNLWFGTNRGLVCFNPDTEAVRVYTTRDGLLSNQFNYKSALKGVDGKFYFGGIDGLVAFNPNISEQTSFCPSIYFSRFRIYNQEITVHTPGSPLTKRIEHTDKIVLNYDQSNISFEVALLNYSTSNINRYEYKLEPLDNEWIKAEHNRSISYAKLPAGNYTLYVRAADGSLKKDASLATRALHIVILPPWWASWWAFLIYIVIVVVSVTYWFLWFRRRKNRQMEEKQKLFEIQKEKELNEMKVDFFTEIAHEVRTPLTLICAPLEVIKEMDIKDVKLNKNLKVIEQNTKRLLDLVTQLLDFQRLGVNKFTIKPEVVDVTALFCEMMDRFEPTIVQRGKELWKEYAIEQDIYAYIDKEAVTKILSNLLTNALKYARHTIRVALTSDKESFMIRVDSDGEKIPVTAARQIFEPFYRMKRDEATAQKGIGIGLSLARSLAGLHKGCLYLDTERPENSFVLTIPLNLGVQTPKTECMSSVSQTYILEDEEKVADAGSGESGENRKCLILLVEDNEDMASFLRERLAESFNVEVVSNGKKAFDVLKERNFDLIVSDIMMPVMNGWELCKAVKTDVDLCHIPLIFLTAKNDLDSKIEGLRLGAEAYVEKPFSFNYLKEQILSLLDNRQKERDAFARKPFFPMHNMQMNKADEEFMDRVVCVIQENFGDENFNVERMADIMCMSRSNLLRKIKMLFNLSPVDFIRLIRLKKAAELIQSGQYRIGDICAMVGISSSSYFTKLFLKQFGMTPKEFEKQCRGAKEVADKNDLS